MTAVAREVMLSLKDIAARDKVSRQAISKQVARLVEHHGLEVARDGRGRVSAVNIVHFDDLRARFGDSSKVSHSGTPERELPPDPGPSRSNDTLDGARRIKLVHETELLRLRLAEDSGQLIRMDVMSEALTRLAEEIGRIVDLLQHADTIAAAAGRGLPELRLTLKRLTTETRTKIADRCDAIAAAAPQKDDALTPEANTAAR
jgi:DNA-binding transcriptional ArsR family regulator